MKTKQSYCVAGLPFSLEVDHCGPDLPVLGNYEGFKSAGEDGIFSVRVVDRILPVRMKPLYLANPESKGLRIDIYSCNDGYVFELAPSVAESPVCRLLTDAEFSRGTLASKKGHSYFAVNNALMLMFAFSSTSGHSALSVHSSVIVNDGVGYLFLGNSGTGKSTHGALWLENVPGSSLLNDDNPVVRIENGSARVYGTPWSGKTPCYKNESAPIGAIVRLRQAPFNRIKMLSLPEAYAAVSSSCSGLRSMKKVADGLFSTVSSVVSSVPCFLLDCLPDKEASVLCHDTVIRHQHLE